MKILHISPYFYPSTSYGGPVNVILNLARAQQKLGHNVFVLTTDAGDIHHRIFPHKQKYYQVEAHYLFNLSNFLAKKFNIYLPIGFFLISRNYIKNSHIIHIHEYFTLLTVIAIFWAKKYQKKIFLQPHGSIVKWLGKDSYHQKVGIKKIFNAIFQKFILKNVSCFLAVSLTEVTYLISLGITDDRIKLINNGVDLDRIRLYRPMDIWEKFFTQDQILSSTKLVFLGRINPIKGLDILINALDILNQSKIKFILMIAGSDDGTKKNLENLINKKNLESQIIFSGLLNEDEKYSLLNKSDIYIQVSRNDQFPVSVAEAICFYKPVILSEQVDMARIVRDKFGLISELSPKSIANTIDFLIKNDNLRAQFIENGKRDSHKIFSWDTISKEIVVLYENDL